MSSFGRVSYLAVVGEASEGGDVLHGQVGLRGSRPNVSLLTDAVDLLVHLDIVETCQGSVWVGVGINVQGTGDGVNKGGNSEGRHLVQSSYNPVPKKMKYSKDRRLAWCCHPQPISQTARHNQLGLEQNITKGLFLYQ